MKRGRLDIYSHHVVFSGLDYSAKYAVLSYTYSLIHYTKVYVKNRGMVETMHKAYAVSDIKRTEFRFHINLLEEIFNFIYKHGVSRDNFEVTIHTAPAYETVEWVYKGDKIPWPYQEDIIKRLSSDAVSKVIVDQPGSGKTLCTLWSLMRLKMRAMICPNAKHIKTWLKAIEKEFDMQEGEVVVIQGTDKLAKFLKKAMDGDIEAKVIFCSINTLRNYFKAYINGVWGEKYPVPPVKMFEVLGVGVKVIDEAHEALHAQLVFDCFTNVKTSIYLSATLENNQDQFMNRILNIMYPRDIRFMGKDYIKFIEVYNYLYRISGVENLRYIGTHGYSHILLEQNIRKRKNLKYNFLNMVGNITRNVYINSRKEGEKCLIYASTVEMCEDISDYLSDLWPDLDIISYTSETDEDELYIQDIVITTIGSCGTGKDVPGLTTVLNTIALGSMQQNQQLVGRIREREDGNTRFYYLTCANIPQHNKYQNDIRMFLRPMIKSYEKANTHIVI